MPVSITVVDAFTDTAFKGNPAAVCLLDSPAPDHWMQQVAAEMNLSETAFLHPAPRGEWRLRWFTPTTEVNLCGHATLAAAHTLWQTFANLPPRLGFHTRSGLLTAQQTADGICLDFPATPIGPAPASADLLLLENIIRRPYREAVAAGEDMLVVLTGADDVENVRINLPLLAAQPWRGLIVSAPGGRDGVDFTSRFFAPAAGIDEDPVTGSAHCALAVYWSQQLVKTRMEGYQASRRGGRVTVELRADRVLLSGKAVTVLTGEFHGAF